MWDLNNIPPVPQMPRNGHLKLGNCSVDFSSDIAFGKMQCWVNFWVRVAQYKIYDRL